MNEIRKLLCHLPRVVLHRRLADGAMMVCEDCGEEVDAVEEYCGKLRCERCIEKLVEYWETE